MVVAVRKRQLRVEYFLGSKSDEAQPSLSMEIVGEQLCQPASKVVEWYCRATGKKRKEAKWLALMTAAKEPIDLDSACIEDLEEIVYVLPYLRPEEPMADPYVVFCAETSLTKWQPSSSDETEVDLRYLQFLERAWHNGCALGAERLAILGNGRGRLKREMLLRDKTSRSSDEDKYMDVVPPGVAERDWTRFVAAREWKRDGDHCLIPITFRPKDALIAYQQSTELLAHRWEAYDEGAKYHSWARTKFIALLDDFKRALFVSTAVAYILSNDPQACLEHLRTSTPTIGPPLAYHLAFSRAESLRRLGFPKLALEVLINTAADTTTPFTEKQKRAIQTAISSLEDTVSSLPAKSARRTKKRW